MGTLTVCYMVSMKVKLLIQQCIGLWIYLHYYVCVLEFIWFHHWICRVDCKGDVEMEDDAWMMVQKSGNQFVVNNQPFYVNGFNTYWLMVFAVDNSTRGKVTQVFQQASDVGLTVCRTWAFNDGQWRALQKKPSLYDEDVFKVLFICYLSSVRVLFFTSPSD